MCSCEAGLSGRVSVLDYGLGNVFSVVNSLSYLGLNVRIISSPSELLASDRVIITGVCAFKSCMARMREKRLDEAILKYHQKERPLLGVCIGMQVLFNSSEEFGNSSGLGILEGNVKKLLSVGTDGGELAIPHVGWSELALSSNSTGWENTVLAGVNPGDCAYFVHSFAASSNVSDNTIANCFYGKNTISSVVQRGTLVGCQFHPEKSSGVGLKILSNFMKI